MLHVCNLKILETEAGGLPSDLHISDCGTPLAAFVAHRGSDLWDPGREVGFHQIPESHSKLKPLSTAG